MWDFPDPKIFRPQRVARFGAGVWHEPAIRLYTLGFQPPLTQRVLINITTIADPRVLIIEIQSTIILMVVEAQGIDFCCLDMMDCQRSMGFWWFIISLFQKKRPCVVSFGSQVCCWGNQKKSFPTTQPASSWMRLRLSWVLFVEMGIAVPEDVNNRILCGSHSPKVHSIFESCHLDHT